VLWDCNGGNNQQWTINSNRTVTGVQSGLCLEPVPGGTGNGVPLQLSACTGASSQQWNSTVAAAGCPQTGHVSYTLNRAAAPTAAQTDAYTRIAAAMDAAVGIYNCNTNITESLQVHYDPSVPTANGGGDTIRFGAQSSMVLATAMHEIAHTAGVGTFSNWSSFVSGGNWTGTNATSQLRSLTGDSAAVLHADQQHFWPYGLNQVSEVSSAEDFIRHCTMVMALRKDMGVA
jgi:hypothetical protein